jgi:hypothetical protein
MDWWLWRRPLAVLSLAALGLLVAAAPATAQTGGESGVGYIDPAIPQTQFRLRYDAAFDDNRLYRAEFFYPKPSAFRTAPPPFTDPSARGEQDVLNRVDFQDITAYLELALTDRVSGFVELPQRFIREESGAEDVGFSDMNAGARLAVLLEQEYGLTLQMRTYIPTGFPGANLGTGHVSLEPALLWYFRPDERLLFEGELRDWVPVGGTDFAGNVLRYGVGVSYNVSWTPKAWIAPVVEFVGWTVLSGKDLNPLAFPVPQNAAGETIVNVKTGIRVGFGPGEGEDRGLLRGSEVYVGYGRPLTGDVWYKDILRVEYRLKF